MRLGERPGNKNVFKLKHQWQCRFYSSGLGVINIGLVDADHGVGCQAVVIGDVRAQFINVIRGRPAY